MTEVLEAAPTPDVTPTTTGTRGKLPHIPALDGLRGVAVLGVLLFHANHLRGGWLGVDLFFVLSGYLITSLLMLEWGRSGDLKLANFWIRRARRLFPALILVLLAISAYAQWFADPLILNNIRGDGFSALFYVANWHSIWSGVTYANAGLAESPLKHMWSLAIEEQFYVIWPLVVLGALRWRNRPDTILRISVALGIVSAGFMWVLHFTGFASDNSLYYGTHTRIAAIAIGASLAAWQIWKGHTRDATRRLTIEGVAVGAVLFLAYMWTQVDVTSGMVYAGGLTLCGIAVVAIIATITHPSPSFIGRVLSFAPLRWLGLISYGLYLWHWPIYLLLDPSRTGLHGWTLVALQLFVSIDVAVLSYFLVEMPIRRGAIKGPQARAAVPAAISLVVIALLVSTLGAETGFADVKTNPNILSSTNAGAVRLMVVGDSVAYSIADQGIRPIRDELGVSLSNASFVGCSLMYKVGTMRSPTGVVQGPPLSSDCTKYWPAIVQKIQPQVVLMAFGAFPVGTVDINGKPYSACDDQYRKTLRQQVESAANALTASGARLVIATGPATDSSLIINVTQSVNLAGKVDCANQVYKDVAKTDPRVKVVDLAALVCPPGQPCVQKVNGVKLRVDGLHFKGEAAKYIARWLIPRTLAAARAK